MAKLGSFFRRIFSSPPESINPELIPFESRHSGSSSTKRRTLLSKPEETKNQSCSMLIQPECQEAIKQPTIHTSTSEGAAATLSVNFLSSKTSNINERRLSAPYLAQTFSNTQNRSTQVDETTEEALISSLQRFSLSTSPAQSQTNHSAASSRNSSIGGTSPIPDIRSASFNILPLNSNSLLLPSSLSNNLLNNVSSASGTSPSQSAIGAQSSSPRLSIQSNNSPSFHGGMKDLSPTSETANNIIVDRKMSLPARGRRPSMFDPIDPKELQQALYASAAAKASIPTKQVEENDPNRTTARIKLCYDRENEQVFIDCLSFENIQILDNSATNMMNNQTMCSSTNNSTNSSSQTDIFPFYCRFRLLPEKRSLFQTKIIRHPRSQSFFLFDVQQLNEFELTYEQLLNHQLEILIYRVGTTKPIYKDLRIASVKFDLEGLNEAEKVSVKKSLEECDPAASSQDPDLGDLLVSLSYLQSAAKLAVVVLEAKNLRPLSLEQKPFPEACVKVTLIDKNGKKIKRKKTSTQRPSDCPTFNEELVFELRRDIAQEVLIELRIVHESLSYKEQLGAVVFGPTISNIGKGSISPENLYWSTILSGESLNAQWQTLKLPIRLDDSK